MAISQMNVRYKIPNISKLDSLFLPAVVVNGIQWKVKVIKNNRIKSLSAFIHCANNHDTVNDWSYTAKYSFKLLSSVDNSEKMEYNFSPYVFDSTNVSWGTLCWIKWNTLFDEQSGYVENDTINLEVSVEAVDPDDPEKSRLIFRNLFKSCEENCRALFQLTVENVDRLLAVKTPLFNEKHMPWTLTVYKFSDELRVRLHANGQKSTKTVHIKLVSSVDGTSESKQSETECIQPSGALHRKKLISWTELLKPENGFIKNNSITINVEITADGINPSIQESKSTIRLECAICFENIQDNDTSSVACGHQFCTACIKQYIKDYGTCPSCRMPAIENDLRRMYLPM